MRDLPATAAGRTAPRTTVTTTGPPRSSTVPRTPPGPSQPRSGGPNAPRSPPPAPPQSSHGLHQDAGERSREVRPEDSRAKSLRMLENHRDSRPGEGWGPDTLYDQQGRLRTGTRVNHVPTTVRYEAGLPGGPYVNPSDGRATERTSTVSRRCCGRGPGLRSRRGLASVETGVHPRSSQGRRPFFLRTYPDGLGRPPRPEYSEAELPPTLRPILKSPFPQHSQTVSEIIPPKRNHKYVLQD